MAKNRVRSVVREIARRVVIEDGDFILIRKRTLENPVATVNSLVAHLRAIDYKKCVVCVVDDFEDFKVVNEREMLDYGWLKKPVGYDEMVAALEEEE